MPPEPISRPTHDLAPSRVELKQAMLAFEKNEFDQAERSLNAIAPQNETEKLWIDHLSGQILFGRKSFDEGATKLLAVYSAFKAHPGSFDADQRRVVAKCLKKIGWNFRRQKDYGSAYTHHHVAYLIYEKFGSFSELHDAAISLDVDAYFLGDAELDEYWLHRSIEAARQITDPRRQSEAIGTSLNNLASTLGGLKRFDAALRAAQDSLEQWQKYETIAGPSEFKLVWAHFGIAEVYQMRARHASEAKASLRCAECRKLALESYSRAAELARLRSMTQKDIDFIVSKQSETEAILCGDRHH